MRERGTKLVKVPRRGARFGDVVFGLAALEFPPPIIALFAENAVRAGDHVVLLAVEGEDPVPLRDVSRPVAGYERGVGIGNLVAGERKLAIVFTAAVHALDGVHRAVTSALEVEDGIIIVVVSVRIDKVVRIDKIVRIRGWIIYTQALLNTMHK